MLKQLLVYSELRGSPTLCGLLTNVGEASQQPNRRRSVFEYVGSWLKRSDAYPLDPRRLPLSTGRFPSGDDEQVHGIFRDAAPDSWGQRVIDKAYPDFKFGHMDYLAATDSYRAGDLSFGRLPKEGPISLLPNGHPIPPAPPASDLRKLLQVAELIEANEPLPDDLRMLLQQGQSLGGARPKASFRDDEGVLWVAKFPARDDTFNMAAAEAACLDMAEACGIQVPERRVVLVGTAPVLLLKRFDREIDNDKEYRLGYMSAATALGVPEIFYSRLSYADLAVEARWLGDLPGVKELFKRMLLDVAVGNIDNHLRNHAFLRKRDGQWCLSPAFDITPVGRPGTNLALQISERQALPDLTAAVGAHARFGIDKEDADRILKATIEVTSQWPVYMKKRGIIEAELPQIAPSFSLV